MATAPTSIFTATRKTFSLIKALGVKAYRFSIAWPRIFPDGGGAPNPIGLDFYNRLIDELLANGIEPYATLYHWDLPQALQDRVGGWQSSDTSKAFGDYSGYVAARLSDRVKKFFTLNEAGRFLNFGYGWGIDAPGLKLPTGELNQARHNVVLGHGLAVQAIRAGARRGTQVGIAENIAACVPAFSTPENIRATEMATRELNAALLGVIMEGKYTDGFLEFSGKDAPKFTAEELKIIGSKTDFVGLNIYAPQFYIAASDKKPGWAVLPFPSSFPHMNSEWLRIGPEVIYWAPKITAKIWNIDAIYISENGTSSEDRLRDDGKVYDLDRISFLRNYLDPVAACDFGRRAGERLFPLESDGQFRMDFWLRQALRRLSRRFPDAGAHAEAECGVLQGCHREERGRPVRRARALPSSAARPAEASPPK